MLRRVALRRCGHSKLPWPPLVANFLGRSDATNELSRVAVGEYDTFSPSRKLYHVIYAAGRAGSGKTEIGNQAPRYIGKHAARTTVSDDFKRDWSNAAYLFVDCGGGGDGYIG